MHIRGFRYALLISLLLCAAPASAQWSIYYQEEKGGPWGKVTRFNATDESSARSAAEMACAGALIRGHYQIPPQYAAKFITPSGKETVIVCRSKNPSSSNTPAKSAG